MTAKEYMQQYLNCENRIRLKLEELDRLRTLVVAVTIQLDDVRVIATPTNKLEKAMEAILMLEGEIADELGTLSETKRTVKNAIHELDDERHRNLLEYRYIVGLTLEEIAERMYYSYSHTKRLHHDILGSLVIQPCKELLR